MMMKQKTNESTGFLKIVLLFSVMLMVLPFAHVQANTVTKHNSHVVNKEAMNKASGNQKEIYFDIGLLMIGIGAVFYVAATTDAESPLRSVMMSFSLVGLCLLASASIEKIHSKLTHHSVTRSTVTVESSQRINLHSPEKKIKNISLSLKNNPGFKEYKITTTQAHQLIAKLEAKGCHVVNTVARYF